MKKIMLYLLFVTYLTASNIYETKVLTDVEKTSVRLKFSRDVMMARDFATYRTDGFRTYRTRYKFPVLQVIDQTNYNWGNKSHIIYVRSRNMVNSLMSSKYIVERYYDSNNRPVYIIRDKY